MCIFRPSCACSKYHPGLCSSSIHSVVSIDSVSRQWRPWSAQSHQYSLSAWRNFALRKRAYSNIYREFHLQKLKIFRKNADIFHISAQNIDYGYSLEPPRQKQMVLLEHGAVAEVYQVYHVTLNNDLILNNKWQMICKVAIKKTSLFKHTENFTTKKWKISDKHSDIFHIFAQNIDCGYSLEPPLCF